MKVTPLTLRLKLEGLPGRKEPYELDVPWGYSRLQLTIPNDGDVIHLDLVFGAESFWYEITEDHDG